VRSFVEQVSKPVLELPAIPIVSDLDDTVFYTKGIAEILPKCITLDLRSPTFEALPVEDPYPALLVLMVLKSGDAESGGEGDRCGKER
jgi:hypothetical protein